MLTIYIPASEQWDEQKQEFISTKSQELRLEHSLVSLSKWEAKWQKPFLSKKGITPEEMLDYVRCMTLTQNVSPLVYSSLTAENVKQINDYIDSPQTATTFHNLNERGGTGEQITSELIYYWMVTLQIPFECEKWHLNRLLTLIKVCSIKNEPEKKMSKKAIHSQNAALNAARRKSLHSRG